MEQLVRSVRFGSSRLTAWVRGFIVEERGQDLLEYAFLAAFVGIAGWAALSSIGPTVNSVYSTWIDPTSGTPSLWDPSLNNLTSAGS